MLVFGHATDAVMAQLGMTPQHLVETGTSLFTVEAHVRYLDQVGPDALLEVRSSIIGATAKKLWIWHELWVAGRLRATEEILGLHVSAGADARTTPFPQGIAARIEALRVEPTEHAGRSISVR
ncbi:MAG: thioesterase [Micrococcales bacterium]|nr:thioesterase [Micrococcales bacterium]